MHTRVDLLFRQSFPLFIRGSHSSMRRTARESTTMLVLATQTEGNMITFRSEASAVVNVKIIESCDIANWTFNRPGMSPVPANTGRQNIPNTERHTDGQSGFVGADRRYAPVHVSVWLQTTDSIALTRHQIYVDGLWYVQHGKACRFSTPSRVL
jgi:hypothetical protein